MNYEEIYNQAYSDTLEKVAMVGKGKLTRHYIDNISNIRRGRFNDYRRILFDGGFRAKMNADYYNSLLEKGLGVKKGGQIPKKIPRYLQPLEDAGKKVSKRNKERYSLFQDLYLAAFDKRPSLLKSKPNITK